MNSKFLYAATLAVSLVSTLALADEPAPVSRDQVKADVMKARAAGTLQRTDYDSGSYRPAPTQSNVTRQQVNADLAQARLDRKALVGPLADEKYNPYGAQVLETSTLARSEVKNEVLQAAANGTLQRNDYDDAQSLARKARAHQAGQHFAQRVKAKVSAEHS